MAAVDCRLIHPQSPLNVIIVEPVREGGYSIYHGLKDLYALFKMCISKRCLPELDEFFWGTVRILTGLSLLAIPFNAFIFQIFVSVAGSYREALRDAVDNGNTETVDFYLSLGVTPNNIYDSKALIFRSKKREIVEALINAGADLSRTDSGKTFLEHLIDCGMEDLAEKHFSRLSSNESMYENAIREKNWPLAAFLVRTGQASFLERERIETDPKTINPLEMLLIKGDAKGLATLSERDGLPQMKRWVKDLQEDFPRMKVDWIWTAILSVYCEDQREVQEETIYELFKCGALQGGENPLGFDKGDFIYWAGMQGREALVNQLTRERLLAVDSSDLEKLLKEPRDHRTFFDFAIRLGYRGTPEEVRGNLYRCKSENPLEGIVATQNNERLQTFVENRTFEEFYEVYLELKTLFPNMYTGWIWNVIYEIPQSHFDQFIPMQQSVAITYAPPRCYPLTDLLAVFDQINFNDPRKGHFIEKEALSETLDSATPVYRTPREIRKGLGNIIQALKTGRHIYTLTPDEIEGYRLQIQWIIHLLKMGLERGPLPRDKANVLIDMGKACLSCPGRYNDIFDIAIKRLKNEKVPVVTFEEQVQRYFADLRSKILNRVVFKEAGGDTHSWENLVHHLHKERALQEPRPLRISSSEMQDPTIPECYSFVYKSDAKEAFDAEYTPDELMGVLSEFARVDRKRTQKENDFNELMMDAMVEAYSKRFPAIQDLERRMKVRMAEKTRFEDQVLLLEEVETLFNPIDPHYRIPKTEESVIWTVAKHFTDFKQNFLAYKIRPLSEETYGYALPEVIHPLVMGKILCDLGHLRQRVQFALPQGLRRRPIDPIEGPYRF